MRLRQRQGGVPSFTKYTKYKRYVREDFVYECTFCAIHENDLGGPRGMHIEHLRPRSVPRFEHLECEYSNLLYSCPVCNTYKGRDWPSDNPVEDGRGYPDPCMVDYDDHIRLLPNYRVEGLTNVGRYLVRRLRLNRLQLVKVRKGRSDLRASVEARILAARETISETGRMAARSDLPEGMREFLDRLRESTARELADAEAELRRQVEPRFDLDDYD